MGRGRKRLKSNTNQQLEAIHKFQQVSWEGITLSDKSALKDFIMNNPDVTNQVVRGIVVSENTLNKWIENEEINNYNMSSWTTGNSASAFANVDRVVDAEDGKRSVILVSSNGMPNSAKLPRTNAYKEDEVLTTTTKFKILNYRKQQPYIGSNNKSPYEMIIFVEPISKRRY